MRSLRQADNEAGDITGITTGYWGRLRRVGEGPGYHLTMRLSDDRVIAPTSGALRVAARVLMLRGAAVTLLALRIADTHLHVLLGCSHDRARHFAHYGAVALHRQLRLPVPFEPSRIRPVVDQRHLYSAFRYVLRQDVHHGIASDPAHDGSSLPDLLGMRVLVPEHPRTVSMILPRLDRRDLAASLGVSFAEAAQVPPGLLAVAAAAALGLAELEHDQRSVLARRAAVHATAELLSTSALSAELGVSLRTIQRLRDEPVEVQVVRAVQLQWRFRASLLERGLR